MGIQASAPENDRDLGRGKRNNDRNDRVYEPNTPVVSLNWETSEAIIEFAVKLQ